MTGFKKGNLTLKQEIFCREYIKDQNGTRAAIAAGYSERTAFSHASRLLRDYPHVIARVAELTGEILKDCDITGEMVIRELAAIAFSDIRDIYNPDGTMKNPTDLDGRTAAAVASIKVASYKDGKDTVTTKRVQRCDKVKALELLMKYLGMDKPKGQEGSTEAITLNFVRIPKNAN